MKKHEVVLLLAGLAVIIGGFWMPFGLVAVVVGILVITVAAVSINARLGQPDLRGARYKQDQDRLGR